MKIISIRQVQMLVFAKFMSDAAWFFLLFWLPKYLYDARGFDVKQVSYFAWIPYAASGVGSFLGGWASSQLLRSGKSLDASRKWVLGINALMMTAVMLVTHVPVGYAIALFSVAFFAQQSWSGIIMTIPADVFPLSAVGTVAGLVGFGGSMGGAIFGLIVGWLLEHGVSYGVLFTVAGLFHLTGFIVFSMAGGRIKPLQANQLIEMGSRA
jgi:ACS family hexuronate transporter-like MFS transporter